MCVCVYLEFAAIRSLWLPSFTKWCESNHKVKTAVDWELNCKVVYIGKKNRRESVHSWEKITNFQLHHNCNAYSSKRIASS